MSDSARARAIAVHLVGWPSAGGFDHTTDDHRILAASAAHADPGRFLPVDDPARADLVIFVGSRDPLHADVLGHPALAAAPRRSFLYSPSDAVVPLLPGLYPSIRAGDVRPGWCRPSGYLRGLDSPFLAPTDVEARASRLFSFVGAAGAHPVRRAVMALAGADAVLVDTTADPARGYGRPQAEYDRYAERYAASIAASRFVLCPRGVGPSSYRIYEAMRAARAPVILSDDWAPPAGPDWGSFALRVPESAVAEIPERVARHAGAAPEMGRLARRAWEEWFGPDRAFSTMAGACAEIASTRAGCERRERRRALAGILRPRPLRYAVLPRLLRGDVRGVARVVRWGLGG